MATQHSNPTLRTPASSPSYPMATSGYGKRSAPNQLPRSTDDFALLPTRERYVAGFVDHLPEGAAMSVKTLAKQLPLYGQQAISTALTALSVAGHLRRVRCAVGRGETTRWAFRTFWSRTARDNEWWNTYLATESTRQAPPAPGVDTAPQPAEFATPTEPAEPATPPEPSAPASVPHQHTPSGPSDTSPAPGPSQGTAVATTPTATPAAVHSPAYLALARLGRKDHRLGLSANDCAALETQAAEWLARGVDADYLTAALTAGLPAHVDSPVGFVRRRLTDKMPPRLPTRPEPASPGAPTHRILVECTECGTPGRPEAVPDGLCRPCRTARTSSTAEGHADTRPADTRDLPEAPDIGAYIAELRDILKAP